MSIFDIFNPKPAAQPAPSQGSNGAPTNPGQVPPNTPATGATGTNTAPNGTLPTTAPANGQTPLDQFADLWKDEPNKNGQQPTGIFGNVDPKKFMEIAGKIDFSKAINPDQLKTITAGGEDAVKALAEVMNTVAQHTYAQSAFATTKITEQALTKARERLLAELPTHIKNQNLSDSLFANNPALSHPAVQPVVDAMKARFAVKYPNATSAELQQLANQAVEAFGAAFAPPKKQEENKEKGGTNKDFDWDGYVQ